MIASLVITVLIEGAVVYAYCTWRRQPLLSLLVTSVIANLITQPLLWVTLNVFFRSYLATLFVAEAAIWLLESLLIYFPNKHQLTGAHALVLSLCMNVLSFSVGWFLPV